MSNWSRAQLKDRAKAVLRVNYWIAFVVALILAFVTGSGSGAGSNSGFRTSYNNNNNYSFEENVYDYDYNDDFEMNSFINVRGFIDDFAWPLAGLAIGVILVILLFVVGIGVFLFNPLAVGCYKFFSTSAETPHKSFAPLGVAFKQGNYWGIVAGMFLMQLYAFLWTLLLIIPGIIKAYAYRMVPYILADNPQMEANEAITLSRKMMDGEKWEAFVLDLSFIGWYLLGLLACCIGIIFVNPYKFSADAQLYLVLRDKAINKGYCTPEMLNLTAN